MSPTTKVVKRNIRKQHGEKQKKRKKQYTYAANYMLSKSEMIAHNLYAHEFPRFSFRHRKKEYYSRFIFNFFPFAINHTIVQNLESAKKNLIQTMVNCGIGENLMLNS